jgi:O-acetylhomoserine/O-acetylserine sulfhydrylase-like pyridoxal-dependent enzyme
MVLQSAVPLLIPASLTGWHMRTSSPAYASPDESYHGIVYAEKFGKAGAFITKCTAQLMRDFGSTPSPQSAFLLNLGLESLHVRMARHCENGMKVAAFLQSIQRSSMSITAACRRISIMPWQAEVSAEWFLRRCIL